MRRLIGAALVALLAPALTASAAPAQGPGKKGGFVRSAVPINDGRLFDLGVSDYNRNGRFEVFSLNHKFLGTLIEGRPGAWTDLQGRVGFSQTPRFPGFEDLLHPPRIDQPGLYIFAEARTPNDRGEEEPVPRFHFVAHRVEGIPFLPEEARGMITVTTPQVQVIRRQGARVSVSREGNPERTVIRFRVAKHGRFTLRAQKLEMPPIEVRIDQAPLQARTFVGASKVRAPGPRFQLRLVDRHGVAWADADGDGLTDAFIVGGGLGGGIRQFRGALQDELLLADVSGYLHHSQTDRGLRKGNCRGRQAAAIDYDGDGRLDLFASCEEGPPKLYRQLRGGRFVDVSRALRRAGARGVHYRWVDLNGNGRPELVIARRNDVVVLRARSARRWTRVQRVRTRRGARPVHQIAVGDFNRSGRPDLFLSAPSGSALLVNRRGRLRARDPRSIGLPARSSAANWVDFDNDGRLDLHVLPGGIYRQGAGGRFRRTGIATGPRRAAWSIASWADLTANGYRDYITAERLSFDRPGVRTRLYRSPRRKNRWLHVDLRGPRGNPEGIGARVTVRTRGGRQTGWVGQSEGSRWSQGHYRVYFGVGKAARAQRVTVRWPNGRRTVRRNVPTNRVLKISP